MEVAVQNTPERAEIFRLVLLVRQEHFHIYFFFYVALGDIPTPLQSFMSAIAVITKTAHTNQMVTTQPASHVRSFFFFPLHTGSISLMTSSVFEVVVAVFSPPFRTRHFLGPRSSSSQGIDFDLLHNGLKS